MTAQPRFAVSPTSSGTELRLLAGREVIPTAAWELSGHPGAAICQRLILADAAIADTDALLVEHAAIARLTAAEAQRLDLPPATMLRAVVEGTGPMTHPSFAVDLRWTRPSGQAVLGAERTGAWLKEQDGWRRLPETLFAVAEAVDRLKGIAAGDQYGRLRALAALREALPQAATAGTAEGSGMLGSITILEADALSLDTVGEGDALKLVPVLHRAGEGAVPLLPEDRQRAFGADQFHRWPTARPVYVLPGGIYVALSPPLRQALDVVRRAAAGTPAQRRAFLREPRAAIRAAIGDEADAAVADALVVETPAWSDRVIGLGLWQPRILPWITAEGNDWFGREGASDAQPSDTNPPDASAPQSATGLMVGDTGIALTPDAAAELAGRIEAAMEAGEAEVAQPTPHGPVQVPATKAALDALRLLIKPNEADRDIEALVERRTGPEPGVPACVRTSPKAHQREGLAWLQASWRAGAPGVLLADDMGLGKTLQGLAFLAWLSEGMDAGAVPRAPLLVVAPTGLLENWKAEHDRHLASPGLGALLACYGRGLAPLRRAAPDGSATLDVDAIRSADWVLTTYETLRDYDTAFGAVRFAAMLLDEAQKVKTPGIRLTDAAKAMNADFRVALTGTPVENRLADLWCIVDGVAPGHLGDLRRFSARYEAAPSVENLAQLKATLDRPLGGRPPLLLRRMKEDRLPDLPKRSDVVLRAEMPPVQRQAYEAALDAARGKNGQDRILEALQRLRAVSLHPGSAETQDDAGLVASSARLKLAVEALDQAAAKGERALVFLDDLDLMARLAGLLQRRYKLPAPPMAISGKVSGAARQARVDRFQAAPDGFDVMLLSPRAGGVGLTLTRANHVVHLARWWNPAVEDQCTGRALRIGQERPVSVYLPLACLSAGRRSFDDNLHALLERKRQLMRDALLPPDADADELAAVLQASLA